MRLLPSIPDNRGLQFFDTMHGIGSEQIVRLPTGSNNILDVFITNLLNLIQECKTIPGITDIVFVETSTRAKRNRPPQRKTFAWKNTDTDTLRVI